MKSLATTIAALTLVLPAHANDTVNDRPHCPGARAGLLHYRNIYTQARHGMNHDGAVPYVRYDCPATVRRAAMWRGRAHAAVLALKNWRDYQYNWRSWLPRGWYGIGSCETGYGGPPNWNHNSGTYQGAFGFAVSSWDSFVGSADPKAGPYPSEAYEATPRQQYEVALAIYRRYGLSGWGCRGAYYR